jgi:hypothetical protein
MKLMFIQELQVLLCQLENLSTQPPHYRGRGQQVTALDAISFASELNSDHGEPPLKVWSSSTSASSNPIPNAIPFGF